MQDSDIPVKILKENADFFADYIYLQFNEAVDSSKFADFFKSADIAVAFIKVHEIKKKKKTADQLVFCLSLKTF